MNMLWRALVILVIIAAIAGGAGYFVYEYYMKPAKLDREEKQAVASAPAPTPTPDPSLAAFEALAPRLAENSVEARDAALQFLHDHPDSPKGPDVRAAVGRINSEIFLTPLPGPDKVDYTVVSGDALVKIAAKLKSSAELIYRANNLSTINLKIGQHLVVPQFDASLIIDREAGTLTVLNKGEFFKEYRPDAVKLPGSLGKGAVETKVADKFMMKGGGRIPFGSKDYDSGDRWITLATSGAAIRSAPSAPADGSTPPPVSGVVLTPEDAAEVFVLVTRGTPVTVK